MNIYGDDFLDQLYTELIICRKHQSDLYIIVGSNPREDIIQAVEKRNRPCNKNRTMMDNVVQLTDLEHWGAIGPYKEFAPYQPYCKPLLKPQTLIRSIICYPLAIIDMAGREQVRTILQSIQPQDLLDVFRLYLDENQQKVAVKWQTRPDKIIEVTFSICNKLVKAIGYTKNEAFAGAARTFLEGLLNSQKQVLCLKQCIKKSKGLWYVGNQAQHSTKQPPSTITQQAKPLAESVTHNPNQSCIAPTNNPNTSITRYKATKPASQKEHQHAERQSQAENICSDYEVKQLKEELSQAQICLGKLEDKLNRVVQNSKTSQKDPKKRDINDKHERSRKNSVGVPFSQLSIEAVNSKRQTPNFMSVCNSPEKRQAGKGRVPRLRLDILPNYHGKSNESLNQSLLDSYNKHHPMRH